MTVRFYSSVAAETTLTATITNAQTTIQVGSVTGLPAFYPYTLALDYEAATEELVEVTNAAGTTLTVVRGIDGTSAAGHNAAARVRHTSSARDFSDSRGHENADDGIHGLDPGDVLVGETKTQTLSNKTLDMATGTLNRIDIFNTGSGGLGWQTTIKGDAAFPSTNLLALAPDDAANDTFFVANNGNIVGINKNASGDSSSSDYRLRLTKSNGSTDIFRVLASGTVRSKLSNSAQGYELVPENDTAGGTQRAFTITTSDASTVRSSWQATGEMIIRSISPANVTMDINAAASQSADVLRLRNSGATVLMNVTSAGAMHVLGSIDTDANLTVDGTSTLTGNVSTAGTLNNSAAGILYRPMQGSQATIVFSGVSSVDQVVNFPVTFASTPRVVATMSSIPANTSAIAWRVHTITTSSFTVRMFDTGSVNRTVNIALDWAAFIGT